jgi:hypothetical protein
VLNADNFRSNELRHYFSTCAELHTAAETGDEGLVRQCLEEIEGIWLHTSSAPLRNRCAAVLAAWHDARPADRGIA